MNIAWKRKRLELEDQGITWNESLAFLQRLGQIEEAIASSFSSINAQTISEMHSLLTLYYLYLYSVIRFEREEYDNTLNEIAKLIKNADLNQDGVLDQNEMNLQTVQLSKAMFMLREMFIKLMCLKVDNGLSIDIAQHKRLKYSQAFLKTMETYVDENILKGDLKFCDKCRKEIK